LQFGGRESDSPVRCENLRRVGRDPPRLVAGEEHVEAPARLLLGWLAGAFHGGTWAGYQAGAKAYREIRIREVKTLGSRSPY
jgi:hypothetical protein